MLTTAETIKIPNATIIPCIADFVSQGRSVTLRIAGNSMSPMLRHERDFVVLSPFTSADIRKGAVVLARVMPDVYVVHRIHRVSPDGTLILMGDGNIGTTEQCTTSDVLAIASAFKRKGAHISTRSLTWRLYSALWTHTPLLLRRIFLAIQRRC